MGKLRALFSSDEALLQKRGYTVGTELGEGTYSKVKIATWVRPGEKAGIKVALKIINKKTAPSDFKEKFLPRELEIIEKIDHPNIIRRYESFDLGGKVYICLEWAGHGDLLQHVRLKGPLKDPESSKYFREMCAGVEYLHKNGIVHRDLKCENVLLSKRNSAKIADFGFARTIGPLEKSKTYCGSAAYAAPELLQGMPYKGVIADVWSLGVILYIMCCSSMPFRDGNIKTLLSDQKAPLHIPRSVINTLSPDLKDLLLKILNFNLEQRYTMAKIKEHGWIKRCLEGKFDTNTTAGTSRS